MSGLTRHSPFSFRLGDSQNRRLTALLAIILAAFILRTYNLAGVELTNDEAFSWRLTGYSFSEIVKRTAADVHPPLHYFTLKIWTGAFGDTLIGMRSLSVVCGLLSVWLVYRIVGDAVASGQPDASPGPKLNASRGAGGALFAASLFSLHSAQIIPSRTARMYSLAILAVLAANYFLLRALKSDGSQIRWPLAYAASILTLCYSHNYGLFVAAAQCIALMSFWIIQSRARPPALTRSHIGAFLWAGALAAIGFLPWLGVLSRQTSEVKTGYWIPELTSATFAESFGEWLAGASDFGVVETYLFMGLFAILLCIHAWRRDGIAALFLIQALAPWAMCVAVSWILDRSILQTRYLYLAHPALIIYVGIAWVRIEDWMAKLALGALALGFSLVSCGEFLSTLPSEPPPTRQAAEVITANYKPGDLVLVEQPKYVNRTRYYCRLAGLEAADVRARVYTSTSGRHQVHVASLDDRDALPEDYPDRYQRVWTLSLRKDFGFAYGFRGVKHSEQEFTDGRKATLRLALFAKPRE